MYTILDFYIFRRTNRLHVALHLCRLLELFWEVAAFVCSVRSSVAQQCCPVCVLGKDVGVADDDEWESVEEDFPGVKIEDLLADMTINEEGAEKEMEGAEEEFK